MKNSVRLQTKYKEEIKIIEDGTGVYYLSDDFGDGTFCKMFIKPCETKCTCHHCDTYQDCVAGNKYISCNDKEFLEKIVYYVGYSKNQYVDFEDDTRFDVDELEDGGIFIESLATISL